MHDVRRDLRTVRPDGHTKTAVASLAVVLLLTGCATSRGPYIPPGLPDNLDQALRAGDTKEVSRLGDEALNSHLGKRFATVLGEWDDRSIILPDEVSGSNVAVLWAGGPCSLTLLWLEKLDEASWSLEGYDKIIVLTLRERPEEVVARVPEGIEVYAVDFPLPGYLQYVYWYPTMFYLGPDGSLKGYHFGPSDPVVTLPTG
jgi:hypothetical protein